MFCLVPASAGRDLAFCLFRSSVSVFVSRCQPGTGGLPSLLPSARGCTRAQPFTEAASLLRKAQAYELGGVKRVRNLKYLKEQQPYCAPSSSDSPCRAGHKPINPEVLTGICFPFPHLLTARHGELSLAQKPDLLTLAQQLRCTPQVLSCQREGCSAPKDVWINSGLLAPKLTPLGDMVLAEGWCHPCVARLDVHALRYRLQATLSSPPPCVRRLRWLNHGE